MQQTRYTDEITAAEWRWVLICATGLALLALLPFLFVPAATRGDGAFVGVLHDPQGSAQALASMRMGEREIWLWRNLHTPEPQAGMVADVTYITLGQVARVIQLEPLALYHIARVLAAIFMFHALYVLGAAIWSRVTARRVFWLIASVGSGLGWLAGPLLRQTTPDLLPSGMFPFLAALSNVHLPLAIACVSFLVAAMLSSLRLDSYAPPAVTNSGLTLIVFSLTLALVYPQAFFPLAIVYALMLAIDARRRSVPQRNWQWFAWFIIPALPLLVYYVIVVVSDPTTMALWTLDAQRYPTPSPAMLAVALGLPLLVALPGLWRAVRRFEPDGSAFMLTWLVVMLALAYLTPAVRGKFLFGLMLPIAYFAARAVEDVWFPRMTDRRWRYRIVAVLLPVLVASNALALFAPLLNGMPGLTLDGDYGAAFNYLRGRPGTAVVAAAGPVGLWLPAWSGHHAVYATSALTLDAPIKRVAVSRFYNARGDADCTLLERPPSDGRSYRVAYVIAGPVELPTPDNPCFERLLRIARFGDVTVYMVLNR